jgi:hypothetical protein
MTVEKSYVTVEQQEKELLKEAKRRDPRFASPSRVTDGGYISLLVAEKLEEFDGGQHNE